MFTSVINKKIDDVIMDIESEITASKKTISLLESLKNDENKIMTEEQYHKFCRTNLRYSDVLGKVLVNAIPVLSYSATDPSCFFYKINKNKLKLNLDDYDILIPSGFVEEIEIVVPKYMNKEPKLTDWSFYKYNEPIKKCENRINELERYFKSQSFKEKIKIVIPNGYGFCGKIERFLTYCFLGKEIESALRNELSYKKEKLQRLKNHKEKKYSEAIIFFKKQNEDLYLLSSELLKWTKKVRILEEGSHITVCEYTKSEAGEICKTVLSM